jgi:hypothetical protein
VPKYLNSLPTPQDPDLNQDGTITDIETENNENYRKSPVGHQEF